VALILSLAISAPGLAQSGENKDFQAIQDERDSRKLRSLIEDFVSANKYPSSGHRPELDIKLMGLYSDNKDQALMIKHADYFAQTQGTADPQSKSKLFTLAMEAARQLGNLNKMNEFADRALAADPNNISVSMTMARTLSENAPNDPAARTASMDKALGYAEKAQKAVKPEKTPDAEWQGAQGRLHGIFGLIYFSKSKWEDAATEFSEYLKKNPTDGLGQYRYGVTIFNQLQTTLSKLQQVQAEALKAQAAGDNDKLDGYAEVLTKLAKDFETQRDLIIDALAKALGISGPYNAQAHLIIDPLYKQKHDNSIDGLDQLILQKRTEMAALAPLPAPSVSAGAKPAGK
jgi:hypothetical protein